MNSSLERRERRRPMPGRFVLALMLAVAIAGCTDLPSLTASPASSSPPPAPTASAPALATPTRTATASPTPTAVPSPSAVDEDDDPASPAPTTAGGGAPTPKGTFAVATGLPVPGSSVQPGLRLPGEPNPALTPGALNPAVTQATIKTTICVSGWTATIRPPTTYTNALKKQQIVTYGYADTTPTSYEEDHLIPLQLGGAPSDPANLWPQPYTIALADGRSTGARVKDAFETALKREVCDGSLTLAEARSEIGIHWVHLDFGIPLAAP